MKKKIIFLIGIIMIILMLLGEYLYFKYKYADTKELRKEDNLAIMVQDNVGKEDYHVWNQDTWPSTSEYYFEKGECEDKSELTWNEATNSISLNSDKRDKCTVYFNKNKTFTLLSGYEVENKEVSLTNILGSAGDFEDSEAWKGVVNGIAVACEMSEDIKKHGKNSCKIHGDSNYIERYSYSTVKYHTEPNHFYYVRLSVYNDNTQPLGFEIYWPPVATGSALHFYYSINEHKKWMTFSYYTQNKNEKSGDYQLRIDNNNNYNVGDIYFDELILVDLTQGYGANIPTQQELDNTLIYFDGTVDLKTSKGDTGVFKLTGDGSSISNKTLECNNGGMATVKNGTVTITGDSATTTCYLKKD